MTNSGNAPRRSRTKITLIALISIIPMVLAWILAGHPEWLGGKTTNYGTLITPARPLDYAGLLAQPISPAGSLSEIKGRWVFLHVGIGECPEPCADALYKSYDSLYKTRQVRLMLNKEIPRLKRLLLLPPEAPGAGYESIRKNDEDLLLANASPELTETLTAASGQPLRPGMVFLLDPLGNLVLWYQPGFDPYRMDKDLKLLLRVSQIG